MAEAKPFKRSEEGTQQLAKEASGEGPAPRVAEPIEEEKKKDKAEEEKKRDKAEEEKKRDKAEEEKKRDKERREAERMGATYRIGQDLIDRINDTAATLGVEKTGFVKALLTHALDDLDAKKWKLPPAQKTKIKLKI